MGASGPDPGQTSGAQREASSLADRSTSVDGELTEGCRPARLGAKDGAESGRPWRGTKAHGRIGRRPAGNGTAALRTRRRSKALKATAPRGRLLKADVRQRAPAEVDSRMRRPAKCDSGCATRGRAFGPGRCSCLQEGGNDGPSLDLRFGGGKSASRLFGCRGCGCASVRPAAAASAVAASVVASAAGDRGAGGNVRKATAAVTRCGCRRGEFFEGSYVAGRPPAARRTASVDRRDARGGNAANPMTGSGMQQAHARVAEQPAEVVRNHGGGTRCARMAPGARRPARWLGVDATTARRWRGGPGRIPGEEGASAPAPSRELRRRGQDQECRTTDQLDRQSRERGEYLEGPTLKRGQGRGGSGRGQRPATRAHERRLRVAARCNSKLARPRGSRQLHGSSSRGGTVRRLDVRDTTRC
jgi:hypothetical protein